MRPNNFDLIRLLAALQVLIYHSFTNLSYLQNKWPLLKEMVYSFPGVPIFFTVSGFLVFRSFYNNPSLSNFFKNRFLRIYPALWFCFIVTVLLLIISGEINLKSLSSPDFYKWTLSQISFFQFYKIKDFLNWGIGHPNGSLWTIFVEIQFYVLVPFLGLLILRFKNNKLAQNLIVLFIGLMSFLIMKYSDVSFLENTNYQKLYRLWIPNFIYFFSFGIFIFINWDFLKKFLVNKALYWFLAYCLFLYFFHYKNYYFENVYEPSLYGFIANLLLSFFSISFAFTNPSLSDKMLKGNDLSYGIYIFHMPFINFAIYFGLINSFFDFSLLFFTIIGMAYFSWLFIESKALNLKRKTNGK